MDPRHFSYCPFYFVAGYKEGVGIFEFIGIKVDHSTAVNKDYFAGYIDPSCKSDVYNHIFNNDVKFAEQLTWDEISYGGIQHG